MTKIVNVRSEKDGRHFWHVDLVNKRCNCPHWMYRLNPEGKKKLCKHLKKVLKEIKKGKVNQ